MSRPHALYLAWGFPPCRGSGVYRALATANALVAGGFDVTVLTCDRETFFHYTLADTTLESHVDPSIDVVRVPFDWPLQETDMRRWDRRRAKDPQAWVAWRVEQDKKEFPEAGYGPWHRELTRAALAVHARRPVDMTVATANPNVTIQAAHELQQRHGVPYVMDQRDAWTLDVFQETETTDERVASLERVFVRDAHEAWFVNEPIRDWHAARYPDASAKIHVVSNGYDPELAPAPRLTLPDPAQPLTFGYIGTITRALPLEEFFEGWALARERSDEVAAATADFYGYLGFFVRQDRALGNSFAEQAGSGVRYCGPLPKTEVRRVYDDFDVLLLVLGTGRYVTSGKVFEYMAAGLPIVSVHHPDVDAGRVLRGYPLWFRAESLEGPAVAEALARAAEAARTADRSTREACVAHAATYARKRQLGPRVEALRSYVMGEGRA